MIDRKLPVSQGLLTSDVAKAAELRELTDELSLRLLERTHAPITAHKGYTPMSCGATTAGLTVPGCCLPKRAYCMKPGRANAVHCCP